MYDLVMNKKQELVFEPMTDEQIACIAEVVADVEAAINSLPEAEQKKYRDTQHSVVEARREGERMARDIFIGSQLISKPLLLFDTIC